LAPLKRHGGIDYVLGRVERHTDTVAGALRQEADRVSIAERNTSSCAASADLIPSASASHGLVELSTSVNRMRSLTTFGLTPAFDARSFAPNPVPVPGTSPSTKKLRLQRP
jgi:hypothetical protein